jgi:trimeric autotransporter adhesin
MKPILTLIILAQLVFVSTALAVPNLINYQGKLTSSTGAELTGTYEMRFQLYPVLTSGEPLWEEARSVQVSKGMYNVFLGGVEPLPPNIAAGVLYLQVSIRNSGGVLEILTPRQRLTSSPYALQATNADRVGGKTPEEIVTGHTHDDRYYTQNQIDEGFASISRTFTLYSRIDHAHDDRYYTQTQLYTKTEVDSHLAGKANIIHTHDDRYYTRYQVYTKSEVDALVNPLIDQIATLQAAVNQLNTLLSGVSRIDNGKILRFSGMNVQVVNGMGSTSTINGLGNLIIGYNENNGLTSVIRCSNGAYLDQATCEQNNETWSHTHKSGSHYLVTGSGNNYSRYGGIVAGFRNFSTGIYSTVMGGYLNTASGPYSSATGGTSNTAHGHYSSVSGGIENTASGYWSSASGGQYNIASGTGSSASGSRNTARGDYSSVSGGMYNTASGSYSSVFGGGGTTTDDGNVTYAQYSTILGGHKNLAGLSTNSTIGRYATVTGGVRNKAEGLYSSVSGGDTNRAVGEGSSVSGGVDNRANGWHSSVSGGRFNKAEAWESSVSGGGGNTASGRASSVSGGSANSASNSNSSVSGGSKNVASGTYSSVSGGEWRSATGINNWRGGSYSSNN